jgi:DNA-binding transcriptional ArsR family regulator
VALDPVRPDLAGVDRGELVGLGGAGPGASGRDRAGHVRGRDGARPRAARPIVLAPGACGEPLGPFGSIYFLTVIYLRSYGRSMFEVLAEPHRRRILDLLREQEQAVGDLVSALGISQPGVSKHLRVLREAGLVEVRTDAQRRVYRLRTEPLREIDEWLAPYRAAWAGRLDALEAHLDDMDA